MNRDPDTCSFLSSRMVEVVAGTDKQIYHVHAAALSTSESPSLKLLVSEKWDPTNSKVVDWSHTESDTVARFLTYLYTGDYRIPDPELIETEEEPLAEGAVEDQPAESTEPVEPTEATDTTAQAEPVGAEDVVPPQNEEGAATVDPVEESDNDVNFQRAILESFENRPLSPFDVHKMIETEMPILPSNLMFNNEDFPHTTHSYARPLLALAQLYCLAVYHLCPALQKSTLLRLLGVLRAVDCSQRHAKPELAQLAQYTYENTPADATSPDPMRRVVSHFVGVNYTSLMGQEFEELFAQGGNFVVDVMCKIKRRLLAEAQTNKMLNEKAGTLESKIASQEKKLEKKSRKIDELQKFKTETENAPPPPPCIKCRKKKNPWNPPEV